MADRSWGLSEAPPAPPLPTARPGFLQRVVAPLGFAFGPRQNDTRESYIKDDLVTIHRSAPLPSQSMTHKTGIALNSLAVNGGNDVAVIAGPEILKIIRVHETKIVELQNIRNTVQRYNSTQAAPSTTEASQRRKERREYLPAFDVKWSHNIYSHIIATAGHAGRIALYDINRPELELCWIYEHTRQVNRLCFDPHKGVFFLSGSQDGNIKLWDLRDLQRDQAVKILPSSKLYQNKCGPVKDIRWNPADAFQYVTCTETGPILAWDIRNMRQPFIRINAHEKACYSVDWHPDGKHVISGGYDKLAKVWNISTGQARQKPVCAVRCPGVVMNVRWRPACWSSEMSNTGEWQSTQFATSYNQEDPRMHIWDLRNSGIPFKEIDNNSVQPQDFLWRDKDKVWSVGSHGSFIQTDITKEMVYTDKINPCPAAWLPNGEYHTFLQSQTQSKQASGPEDPNAYFLNIEAERLSGDKSEVMSEDDEDTPKWFKSMRIHRGSQRHSVTVIGDPRWNDLAIIDDRNSPRSVLSLDEAIAGAGLMGKGPYDRPVNPQMSSLGSTRHPTLDEDTVKYLADNYAPWAKVEYQKLHPESILPDLEAVCERNAEASEAVNLYRLGGQWRLLGEIAVNELRYRAEANRKDRLWEPKDEPQAVKELAKWQKTYWGPNGKQPTPPLSPTSQAERKAWKIERHVRESREHEADPNWKWLDRDKMRGFYKPTEPLPGSNSLFDPAFHYNADQWVRYRRRVRQAGFAERQRQQFDDAEYQANEQEEQELKSKEDGKNKRRVRFAFDDREFGLDGAGHPYTLNEPKLTGPTSMFQLDGAFDDREDEAPMAGPISMFVRKSRVKTYEEAKAEEADRLAKAQIIAGQLEKERLKSKDLLHDDFVKERFDIPTVFQAPDPQFMRLTKDYLTNWINDELKQGIGCGLVAAHLTLHFASFFFPENIPSPVTTTPQPSLTRRRMQLALQIHYQHLRSQESHIEATAMRKAAHEQNLYCDEKDEQKHSTGFTDQEDADYPEIFGRKVDEYRLKRVCQHCRYPVAPTTRQAGGGLQCQNCGEATREPCCVCNMHRRNVDGQEQDGFIQYCQRCLHGGHPDCLWEQRTYMNQHTADMKYLHGDGGLLVELHPGVCLAGCGCVCDPDAILPMASREAIHTKAAKVHDRLSKSKGKGKKAVRFGSADWDDEAGAKPNGAAEMDEEAVIARHRAARDEPFGGFLED